MEQDHAATQAADALRAFQDAARPALPTSLAGLLFVAYTSATLSSKGPGTRSISPIPTLLTFCLIISRCGSTTMPWFVRTKAWKGIITVSHAPGV